MYKPTTPGIPIRLYQSAPHSKGPWEILREDTDSPVDPSEDTDSPMDLVPERHKALHHIPPPSLEVTFKVPRADGGPSECGIEYRTVSCLPVIVRIVPLIIICISKIFTWRQNNVPINKNVM